MVDVGLGTGDGEFPVAAVGGIDEGLDSPIGTRYVAFCGRGVFYPADAPLWQCGPIGIALHRCRL